ncbi:MAG: hypothetical protein ChlgKO_15070 [Chlamydiales bacterium]
MPFLISLLLFCSTYKDHIGQNPLRIEGEKIAFALDRRRNLDKITATKNVKVDFANKVVIETDTIYYINHDHLESSCSGTCHLSNGELEYEQISYDLKKEKLKLANVKGELCYEESSIPVSAKKLTLDKDTLIFENDVSLLLPTLGELQAKTNVQFLNEHLFILGKMDLFQKGFHLHSDDQFHYDAREGILTVTSRKGEQILFETNELKLLADEITLDYKNGRALRVMLEGAVRIEPNSCYVAFDSLLCDRVDFPLEESAMLLVTKERQQHLFWEHSAPNTIYLGEGEIPKR